MSSAEYVAMLRLAWRALWADRLLDAVSFGCSCCDSAAPLELSHDCCAVGAFKESFLP